MGFFRLAPCGAEDFESRAKRHELYVTLVNELGYDEDEAETIAFG